MTREEAINWLKAISFVSDHRITEALDMAIEALSANTVHESCNDCPLYDQNKHNCPRFNKIIPQTIAEAIQQKSKKGEI